MKIHVQYNLKTDNENESKLLTKRNGKFEKHGTVTIHQLLGYCVKRPCRVYCN